MSERDEYWQEFLRYYITDSYLFPPEKVFYEK